MKIRTPVLFVAATIIATTLRGVTLGQVDTFEDGTTAGWHVGPTHPAPPANIASGGPAGTDDNFLRLTALGTLGAGSRLSVLSGPQWAGDYLAAGITQLVMDVNNFGPNDVFLRLLFEDLQALGPPLNLALSANPVFVSAGSGWSTVAFDIRPLALLSSFGTVGGALANTDVVRLFHNADASFPGPVIGPPAVTVQLGIDNIRAVAAVPDSSVPGVGFLLLALCAVGARRRRK